MRLQPVLRGRQGALRVLPLHRAEHPSHALLTAPLHPSDRARARGRGLYEDLRIPPTLGRRLEQVLRVEAAELERHRAEATEFWAGAFASSPTSGRSCCAPTTPMRSTLRPSSASRRGSTPRWRMPSHSSRPTGGTSNMRSRWNQAFFRTIRVRDGAIASFTYEEPFASLFGSHKGSMVEVRGFEPLTPAVRRQCSTGLSYTPLATKGSSRYPSPSTARPWRSSASRRSRWPIAVVTSPRVFSIRLRATSVVRRRFPVIASG